MCARAAFSLPPLSPSTLAAAAPLRGDAGDWSKRDESERWWEQADAVSKVQLSRNELRELPEAVAVYAESCEVLDVSSNRLEALPHSLGDMCALRRLDAARNRLGELPAGCLARMPLLALLDISQNALRALPEELAACGALAELSCANNMLEGLPRTLAYCRALRRLDASGNAIGELDCALPASLQLLDVHTNALVALPADLGRCVNLEWLSAHSNKIRSLPASIGALQRLRELHLKGNALQLLPEEMASLLALRMLDLSDNLLAESALLPVCGLRLERLLLENNRLRTLPPEMGEMLSLQTVSLSGNPLKMIPHSVAAGPVSALLELLRRRMPAVGPSVARGGGGEYGCLSTRAGGGQQQGDDGVTRSELSDAHTDGRLCIKGRQLERFPLSVFSLGERLRYLDASGSRFAQLPPGWAEALPALRELDLSDNLVLRGLPPDMAGMFELESLFLRRCRALESLAPPLPHLRALRSLDVSGVGPNAGGMLMDACLEELPALAELRLARCSLARLPAGLCHCAALETLDASGNALTDVARDSLHALLRLSTLDLSNNGLRGLPDALGSMGCLVRLEVMGNVFKQPPLRVVDKGTEAVKAWLRQRAGVCT